MKRICIALLLLLAMLVPLAEQEAWAQATATPTETSTPTPTPTVTPTPTYTPVPVPPATRGEAGLAFQLAGMRLSYATGGAALADITVTGVEVGDPLISVLQLTSGAFSADLRLGARVTAANTIKLNADTTGDQVLVLWLDLDAYSPGQ